MQELALKRIPDGATIFRAVGCPSCSQSGYSGRTVAHELLLIDDKVRSLIVRNSDAGMVKKAAQEAGMQTLREDCVQKVMQGMTTVDELMRATQTEA
jgi:general secretion pathway protein E